MELTFAPVAPLPEVPPTPDLPYTTVIFRFFRQDGSPDPDARVTAQLDRYDTFGGAVVPRWQVAEANASGVATIALFPNELGSAGSNYIISMRPGGARANTYLARVPNATTVEHTDLDPPLAG